MSNLLCIKRLKTLSKRHLEKGSKETLLHRELQQKKNIHNKKKALISLTWAV